MVGQGPTGQSKKLSGTGYNQVTINTLSPEQQQLFQQLLGGSSGGLNAGLGNLSRLAGGDQSQFQEMEAPALRQFGQLQGNIASRFAGMGSGSRRSSGFQNTLSGAGTDLAERLASQRMGYQQSAISQLLGLSNSLLGRQTQENFLTPKQKPFWQELLAGLSTGAGNAIGSLPMLAAL